MTINIYQAFRPLLLTYFLIGLGVYPRKEKATVWWNMCRSILYSLAIWFVYGYILYYLVRTVLWEKLFTSIIPLMIITINIITTIITVIISIYYHKRFIICMKKLAAVDDTLEKLGSPKIYRKIRIWSKRMVIGWILRSIAINCYDILWWSKIKETAPRTFLISHIINHCFNVNMFVDLVYLTFFWYIGNRFDKINEHMRYLIVNEEHNLRRNWKKPVIIVHRHILYCDNYKRVLWSSMHLHLELCHAAREINMMCGTQMTFAMATYLLFLTGSCYYLYKFIQMEEHQEKVPVTSWFHIVIWGFEFVARLWAVNYICENISIKASKIEKIIHQLTNILRYADMWNEIHQFSLQTMYHPLKFTGMGLFYFGNDFLRKFFMTIVTLVILIMQMSRF